jgi:uncharacterized protein DUF4129
VLLAGAVASPAAATASPDTVRHRVRAALADGRFQRELPAPPRAAARGDGQPAPFHPAPRGPGRVAAPAAPVVAVGGAAATRVGFVFWVLLAAAIGLAVIWTVQAFSRPRRRSRASAGGAAREPAAPPAAREPPPSDAARLAAEGRYAEAVHALLLAAIRHLAERSRLAVPPSRTSRELMRTLPLKGDSRQAFAELVAAVERSLFGGAAVGEDDYRQSLARFRSLVGRGA